MSKFKVIITVVIAAICAVLFCIQWIYMDEKANDMSQQGETPYSMFSGRLKSVVSKEEFINCKTDTEKYNMYLKFQNAEYVQPPKHHWSTNMWKTPQRYERLKTDKGDFTVLFQIDYAVHLWGIEIINFVPEIYS